MVAADLNQGMIILSLKKNWTKVAGILDARKRNGNKPDFQCMFDRVQVMDNNNDEEEEKKMDGMGFEVKRWLKEEVKMEQYCDLFVKNGYDDMETVLEMNDNELIEIGIDKKGHRKKILIYIEKKKNNNYIEEEGGVDAEGINVVDTGEAAPDIE